MSSRHIKFLENKLTEVNVADICFTILYIGLGSFKGYESGNNYTVFMLAFTVGDEHESMVLLHRKCQLILVSFHLNSNLPTIR